MGLTTILFPIFAFAVAFFSPTHSHGEITPVLGASPCHYSLSGHEENFRAIGIPRIQSGYEARTYSSPVKTQCTGSCGIMSHVSHLESLARVRLKSLYNVLSTMLENSVRQVGKIHSLERQEIETMDFSSVPPVEAPRFVLLQGVLPSNANLGLWDFRRQLILTAKKLGLRSHEGTIKSEELPQAIQEVYNQLFARAITGDEGAFQAIVKLNQSLKKTLTPLWERARSTYTRLFGHTVETQITQPREMAESRTMQVAFSLFREKYETLPDEVHWSPAFRNMGFEEMINYLTRHLDLGETVQLSFFKPAGSIDPDTGVARLGAAFASIVQNKKRLVQEWINDGHSALIETYRKSRDGEVEFLVKDSLGTQIYDRGYIHMSAEFVYAMMWNVSVVTPSLDNPL